VVLKLTPDRSIAESEAIALRAWARTSHAVDLLESDPEAGALLLDRVTPGTKAAAWPGLPPFEDFAELLAGLRDADGQDGATLRSSAEGVEFIYGLIARRARDPYVSRFVPPDMVARGHALARELTAGTGDYGLVHGDLHLFNILDGGPARGLVAIDPRPSCGDRTWDAIDIALARVTSAGELDDRISRITALVPGLNPGRLRQWCQATAVISVVQRLFRYRHDGAAPDKLLLDLAASACKKVKRPESDLCGGPDSRGESGLAEEPGDEARLTLDSPRPVPDGCGELVQGAGGEVAPAVLHAAPGAFGRCCTTPVATPADQDEPLTCVNPENIRYARVCTPRE
jgi:streptomycin 6-kinase